MSSINSDTLLSVALILNRSRDGPAFVFHYPPHVPSITEASSAPDTHDLEDILLERLSLNASRTAADQAQRNGFHDDHVQTDSGLQIVPWEHVAGFPTADLASILTPARAYHKKLFQLSLDPVYCICAPIHVPENGRWKKPKKDKKARALVDDSAANDSDPALGKAVEALKDSKEDASSRRDSDGGGKKEDDEEKRASMTMFNLVFFLDPKEGDIKDLAGLLYSNIIKKINKVYRYAQQQNDYIWKESKRILATKEKGREQRQRMTDLWKEIMQTSSLASSVREIYDAVSQNRIATLHLETVAGIMSPSVQIPVPFHVSDLPPEGAKDQVGLWLSTSNAFLTQEAMDEPGVLDRSFGMLLMEDPKKIGADLATHSDSPMTQALIEFLRHAKPTLSFHQIATMYPSLFTPSQVRKYAQHFIYWRRSIAIPPLHARDTYVVSPNANLSLLPSASAEWSRLFSTAPALPTFLADLSNAPRPYKSLCPNKVYRPQYLQMLAWLMRGGWVTQLCTFAYVVVWPEILYEVDYEMEKEEIETEAKRAANGTASSSPTDSFKDEDTVTASPEAPTVPNTPTFIKEVHDVADNGAVNDLQATHRNPSAISLATSTTATADPSTESTAEAARLHRLEVRRNAELASKTTTHSRRQAPVATAHPSTNAAPHLAHLTPHIVSDPKKATGRESRYLSAISKRLEQSAAIKTAAWKIKNPEGTTAAGGSASVAGNRGRLLEVATAGGAKKAAVRLEEDGKTADTWARMLKYFDGRTALERVALLEGERRKEVWGWVAGMGEYLVCVRHW